MENDQQFYQTMQESVMVAYQENQAQIEALSQSFGGLAQDVFADFGCDE